MDPWQYQQPDIQTVFSGKDLDSVDKGRLLNGIKPRGGTPLHDAVCQAMEDLKQKITKTRKTSRPDTVTVVIFTDGEENRSKKHNLADVQQTITEAQERGWNILFLGAGIDAFATGRQFGLADTSIKRTEHSSVGTRGSMAGTSSYVGELRMGGSSRSASKKFDDTYQGIVMVEED